MRWQWPYYPKDLSDGWTDDTKHTTDVHLAENDCGRYHSYFNTVKIETSPAIMLSGMEECVLGAWCSHGEGWWRINHININNKY